MGFSARELNRRRCFVTGGAGAIGRAAARRLCEQGATAVISDIDGAAVTEVAQELTSEGLVVHPVELDVTVDADVSDVIKDAARRLGGLDTLIATAGVISLDRIEETTPESFRRMLEINLVGTFLCIRHAVPLLRESGDGVIICTASHAGLQGAPEVAAYCASKFGVVGLVQSLARELGPSGVRVCAVAPGLVDTPMLSYCFERRAQLRGLTVEEYTRQALDAVPMGRLARPDEVADVIAFLASASASYVSGMTLPILGGEPV